jgi:hypothetical protein
LPITPVLGQLRDLIGGGESASEPQHVASLMRVITFLRLTGHTNIAAGLRHHAHKPTRPINAILAS